MDEILSDSTVGSKCLTSIYNTFRPSMLVRMTELWVEAEAFGAEISITEHAFPVIESKVIPNIDDIGNVSVPEASSGRLSVFIDAVRKTRLKLPDVLLFAGVTGPFSLGSCLTDAEELMMSCYTDPDTVHSYMEKLTEFIVGYCKQYRDSGASGVFVAEPSICMLSPDMAEEFSNIYIKKIISEIQDDDFAVVYHNCGNCTPQLENIKNLGAMAYHFGDAVSMQDILGAFPKDIPILGNIHPAKFMPGNEKALENAAADALTKYSAFPNFILSSGCDMAPDASVKSIEYFMHL